MPKNFRGRVQSLLSQIEPSDQRSEPEGWTDLYKWGQRGLLVIILAYLFTRLMGIGWADLAEHLPTSPLFYVYSILIFLTVPVSEIFNYRLITGIKIPNGLKIFSRKRVFNEALLSYSGEAFLVRTLARLPGYTVRKAFMAVKDNNLISALVSNTWTIFLVIALAVIGQPDILKKIWHISPLLVGSFATICIILYVFVVLFFHRISALILSKRMKVTAVHSAKVLIVAALQIAQWASAIPTETAVTWLMFLAVQTLVKRIPGLPNGDLVFLGVGLSLVGFTNGDHIEVSAMLLAATAMTQLVQLVAFIVTIPRE